MEALPWWPCQCKYEERFVAGTRMGNWRTRVRMGMAEYLKSRKDNCSHYSQDLHSVEGMLVHNLWLVAGSGSCNHLNCLNCSGKSAECYGVDESDGTGRHVTRRGSFARLRRYAEFSCSLRLHRGSLERSGETLM